jgi:predicted dehydrogenase
MIEEATALVEAAAHHGVILGVNAQYPAALEGFTDLHRQLFGRAPEFHSLHFVMESKGKPRSAHGPAEVWVDLGPHPLAFIDRVAAGGVDWATLRHSDGPLEAILDFDWVSGELRLPVHIECRRTTDGSVRRRLGNQDLMAEYEGRNIDGEFRSVIRSGDREWVGQDFMQVSIERFVQAVRAGDPRSLLVDANAGLRQEEALVGVWQHCWR